MEDSIRSLFLKEKPAMVLVKLKSRNTENYASELAKAVDSTYAHTTKLIHRFEDLGLVESEVKGRKKMLTLTEEGRGIAEKAQVFVAELDEYNQEQGGA